MYRHGLSDLWSLRRGPKMAALNWKDLSLVFTNKNVTGNLLNEKGWQLHRPLKILSWLIVFLCWQTKSDCSEKMKLVESIIFIYIFGAWGGLSATSTTSSALSTQHQRKNTFYLKYHILLGVYLFVFAVSHFAATTVDVIMHGRISRDHSSFSSDHSTFTNLTVSTNHC